MLIRLRPLHSDRLQQSCSTNDLRWRRGLCRACNHGTKPGRSAFFSAKQKSVVRLPHSSSALFAAKSRRRLAGVFVCALASFAVLKTCAVAASGRTPNFSGGFGDYYVGVLYRGGNYLDATALAQGLLDSKWTIKEAECVRSINRAYLLVQIYRRLGRDQPALGLLGAQVQALRHWVRGPEAVPGPVQATAAAVQPVASARTRVLGWHMINLEASRPVPLAATPATVIALKMAAPLLQETPIKQAVRPTKSYEPPRPKTVAVAPVEPETAPKPVVRKQRPSVKAVATTEAKPLAPPQRMEDWAEKAFVN